MNSKIVLTIQKQLKDITNKKFSKKYINKNILPIINHIVSSDKKKFLIGGSQGVGKSTLVYVIKKNIQTFYNKRVLTLSLDDYYLSKKKNNEQMFEKIKKNKIDILVGTQMISKGLDFNNVQLVGVINADYGMFTPDFRAGEKIYQIMRQQFKRCKFTKIK